MKIKISTVLIISLVVCLIMSVYFYDRGYKQCDADNEMIYKTNYQTKCFQRILGWDRTWDIENNFISGSYWNTTWHETICGEYDNYKLMDYKLRDVKYEDFKKEENKE